MRKTLHTLLIASILASPSVSLRGCSPFQNRDSNQTLKELEQEVASPPTLGINGTSSAFVISEELSDMAKSLYETDARFKAFVDIASHAPDSFQQTQVQVIPNFQNAPSPELDAILASYASQPTQPVSITLLGRTISPDLSRYREFVSIRSPTGEQLIIKLDDDLPQEYQRLIALRPNVLDNLDLILSQRRIIGNPNLLDRIATIAFQQSATTSEQVLSDIGNGVPLKTVVEKYLLSDYILLLKKLQTRTANGNTDFCLEHNSSEVEAPDSCIITQNATANRVYNVRLASVFGDEWTNHEAFFFPFWDKYDVGWRNVPVAGINHAIYRIEFPFKDLGEKTRNTIADLANPAMSIITSEALDAAVREWNFDRYYEFYRVNNYMKNSEIFIGLASVLQHFWEELTSKDGAYYQQAQHNVVNNFSRYEGQPVKLRGRLLRRFIVTDDIREQTRHDQLEGIMNRHYEHFEGKRCLPVQNAGHILNSVGEEYGNWFRAQFEEREILKKGQRSFSGNILWVTEFYELEFPNGETSLMAFKVAIPEALKKILDKDLYFFDRFNLTAIDSSYLSVLNALHTYLISVNGTIEGFSDWVDNAPEAEELRNALTKGNNADIPLDYLLPFVENARKMSKQYDQLKGYDHQQYEDWERRRKESGFFIGFRVDEKGNVVPSFSITEGGNTFTVGLTLDGQLAFGYTSKHGIVTITEAQINEVFKQIVEPPRFPTNDGLGHIFEQPDSQVILSPTKSITQKKHGKWDITLDNLNPNLKLAYLFDEDYLRQTYRDAEGIKQWIGFMEEETAEHVDVRAQVTTYLETYAKNHDPQLLQNLDKLGTAQLVVTYEQLVEIEKSRNPFIRDIDVEFGTLPETILSSQGKALEDFVRNARYYAALGIEPQFDISEIRASATHDGQYTLFIRGEYTLPNGGTYVIDSQKSISGQFYKALQENPGLGQRMRAGYITEKTFGGILNPRDIDNPSEGDPEAAYDVLTLDMFVQKFYFNPELRDHPNQPTTVVNQGRVIDVKEEIRRMEQIGPAITTPK